MGNYRKLLLNLASLLCWSLLFAISVSVWWVFSLNPSFPVLIVGSLVVGLATVINEAVQETIYLKKISSLEDADALNEALESI